MSTLARHQINYLKRYTDDPLKNRRQQKRLRVLLPVLLLALLIAAGGGYCHWQIYRVLQPQLQQQQAYLADEDNQTRYQQASELQDELARLENAIATVDNALAAIDGFPLLDGELYQRLRTYAGQSATFDGLNYDRDSASFSISGVAASELSVPPLVSKMRGGDDFALVNYYGYIFDAASSGEPQYRFQIYTQLAAEVRDAE